MGDKSSQIIHLEMPCDPDAPCLVREAVDAALEGWRVREQARLIASELVTNAVRHSGAGPDQLIEFRATVGDGSLLLAVSDPGVAGQDAHIRAADPDGGGYGLRIVDRLATRWGSDPNGQRVWAELPISS